MNKILDNTVIECCGKYSPPSSKCPHWNTGAGILRELKTIDKDCPLAECWILSKDKNKPATMDNDDLLERMAMLCTTNYKDVETIIIVKKKLAE